MARRINTMKAVLVVVIAMAIMLTVTTQIYAKDVMLESKIQNVTVNLDKNGNEYVRVIIEKQKELNGVAYTIGVPVMAFGDIVNQARNLIEGDSLKAICSAGEYKGRTSYTLLAIIE